MQNLSEQSSSSISNGKAVTQIEIVPLYGSQPLSSAAVVIRINPEDLKRAHLLVENCKVAVATTLNNQQEFDFATRMARHLKSMLIEIDVAKKQAKRPFMEVLEQIEAAATGLTELVKTEHEQVLKALSDYVTKLEAAKKEQERKRQEQIKAEQEEFARRIADARKTQATEDALTRMELAAELALDAAEIGQNKPTRGLVPGGRVSHPYKFELVDLGALLASGKKNLVRCTIDYYACLDEVRYQVDRDPGTEPDIPGIKITRETTVSVKP